MRDRFLRSVELNAAILISTSIRASGFVELPDGPARFCSCGPETVHMTFVFPISR
jgi:hypothetical protein